MAWDRLNLWHVDTLYVQFLFKSEFIRKVKFVRPAFSGTHSIRPVVNFFPNQPDYGKVTSPNWNLPGPPPKKNETTALLTSSQWQQELTSTYPNGACMGHGTGKGLPYHTYRGFCIGAWYGSVHVRITVQARACRTSTIEKHPCDLTKYTQSITQVWRSLINLQDFTVTAFKSFTSKAGESFFNLGAGAKWTYRGRAGGYSVQPCSRPICLKSRAWHVKYTLCDIKIIDVNTSRSGTDKVYLIDIVIHLPSPIEIHS